MKLLSESGMIQMLQAAFPEHIGDDAASIPLDENHAYLITKDLLVENTHFRRRYQSPESLAHKALHVNLSDLAAMGATPKFVLLGLSIPKNFQTETPLFLSAFESVCKKASVLLIGGDTTRAEQHLMLSITAIGIAPHQHIKYRTHAKPGDLLCVAGNIGHAHLGFIALEQNQPDLTAYKEAFLNPHAQVAAGIWLGQQNAVTSMMDTSDGLWLDLNRLCEASNLGCNVALDAFTPDTTFQSACNTLALDPISVQLSGGEDYALLFSVEKKAYTALAAQFNALFPYALKTIGTFKKEQNINWLKDNKSIHLNVKPFLHFE